MLLCLNTKHCPTRLNSFTGGDENSTWLLWKVFEDLKEDQSGNSFCVSWHVFKRVSQLVVDLKRIFRTHYCPTSWWSRWKSSNGKVIFDYLTLAKKWSRMTCVSSGWCYWIWSPRLCIISPAILQNFSDNNEYFSKWSGVISRKKARSFHHLSLKRQCWMADYYYWAIGKFIWKKNLLDVFLHEMTEI